MQEFAFDENTLSIITKRQNEVDGLPIAVKELVWDYGWGVVSAYIRSGVTAPTVIRHLIEITLKGSHEIRASRFETRAISLAGEDMNKALNEFSMPGNGQALVESLRAMELCCFQCSQRNP